MAKKVTRTAIDLDGFDEITVTRTRHSDPTLYVNTTEDAKYPIARLSMGAVALLRPMVGDGEEIKVRLLHNAKTQVAVLVVDSEGYTVAENGGLSGGAFADARMIGPGVKGKFPVETFGDVSGEGTRGLRFSSDIANALFVDDDASATS